MIEIGNIFCGSLCWMWDIFSKECKQSTPWVCFKVRPSTIRSTCNSCLPLSPTYLVKIPSVLRVAAHTSTQSVVSLSAFESFQGAEEFTPSLDLSVGGIGNCKDKSPQQLKSSLLCTRACGISQISQIRPCPPCFLSEIWPCPLPPSAWRERWRSGVFVLRGGGSGGLTWLISLKVSVAQHISDLWAKRRSMSWSHLVKLLHFLPPTCYVILPWVERWGQTLCKYIHRFVEFEFWWYFKGWKCIVVIVKMFLHPPDIFRQKVLGVCFPFKQLHLLFNIPITWHPTRDFLHLSLWG